MVLESTVEPAALERRAATLLSERFGFEVPVVVRTRRELAAVVKANPLGDVADNPKRYQVSFLSAKPDPAVVRAMQAAVGDERVVAHGRQIYAWHPDGVARSKLWNALAEPKGLGVTATARNWTTVITLLEMAGG